ncbi:MAG: hypothetical protein ACTSUE_04345 [Promethearchaeota archaeon]
MVKIIIPGYLAPECKDCKGLKLLEWEAKDLDIKGKDEVTVPFRIHVENYPMDSTKFKLIDYKSTRMEATCESCEGAKVEAHLLFDDAGRSFGIFTGTISDRYLFQHSSEIDDKEAYMKKLASLDFID